MDIVDPLQPDMETRALPDVTPANDEWRLLEAVAEARRLAGPGPTTLLGLRNEAGSIYRVVYARGAAHALELTRIFEELGLTNDASELDKARSRCDAIYARPGTHPLRQRRSGLTIERLALR